MSNRTITILILLGTVAVWMPWESYVIRQGDPDATFSNVLRDFFLAHPYITFGAGLMVGHILERCK